MLKFITTTIKVTAQAALTLMMLLAGLVLVATYTTLVTDESHFFDILATVSIITIVWFILKLARELD